MRIHGTRPIFFAAESAIFKLVPSPPVEPQIVPARFWAKDA